MSAFSSQLRFPGAGGTEGAGVGVAERAAAQGGGLAVESAGHAGTTFGDHEVPFLRVLPYPPGVFGATLLFSMGWSEGAIVKYFVSGTWKPSY